MRRVLSLACACLALVACGRSEPPPNAAGAASGAPAKVHVVGTDAAYAPFESQDEKGEIVGFDIDLVRAIARRAGLEVRFVNTPWEGIFNALAQGDRDLLVSAITITPARRESMDFTRPYFDARQLIAVRNDSRVARFTDLRSLKVGVQTGTTGDEAVSRLLGANSPDIRRFESTPLALKELEAGGVDAVVADNGVVAHHVANNPGARFRSVDDPAFTPEQYGIAVRKGNATLLARLDEGLAGIRADGTYARLYARYFGASSPSAAPAAASAVAPGPASAPR